MYEARNYRYCIESKDLVVYNVTLKETDLYIRASKNIRSKALKAVKKYRKSLESYIKRYPDFQTALEPVEVNSNAPLIVKLMEDSAVKAGVGPMASVAGAIAELVGGELLEFSPEIIIENGGDIYINSHKDRTVSVFAGESALTGKIGLVVKAERTPCGICTSSGTVGHSLSYGKADAVVVAARSTALADASATAIGNLIKTPDDIQKGIEYGMNIEGLRGILIIIDDGIGAWGEIELCRINPDE